MAKKKKRRRSRTIAILPIIGLAGGLSEPIQVAMRGDFENAANLAVAHYTGYNFINGTYSIEWLKKGWIPLIAGVIGHKAANMLGINRAFADLPSPLNKLRL